MREDILLAGVLHPLLALLESRCGHSEAVRQEVARTLTNLAFGDLVIQAELEAKGAVRALVPLLGPLQSDMTHELAAQCLSIFTASSDASRSVIMMSEGGLTYLVALMGPQSCAAVKERSAQILMHISINAANKASIVAAGAIPALVSLLGPVNSLQTQFEAMRAMRQLAASDFIVMVKITEAGIIPRLVSFLTSSTSVDGINLMVKEAAAALLVDITNNSKIGCRAKVVTAGVIPPLIRLLGSQDPVSLQENAARMLLNIINDSSTSLSKAVAAGALPALVSLLKARDGAGFSGLQATAAKALEIVISHSPDHYEAAVAAGVIAPLVALLKEGGSSIVHEQAARALICLTSDAQNKASIVEAGGLQALVQLLKPSGAMAVQEHAAWLLRRLAAGNDGSITSSIVALGFIPLLVTLLEFKADTTSSAGSKLRGAAAAAALHSLAVSAPMSIPQIISAGAIPLLVSLLDSNNSHEAHEHAAGTLKKIALNSKGRSMAAATGAIPPLVELISNDHPEAVQEHAAGALWSLAFDSESKLKIKAAGGVSSLACLAKSTRSHRVQANAAGALDILNSRNKW